MLDAELAAIREDQRARYLRREIEQMLDNESDYRQIAKTLDYNCYSSPDRLAVVRVLCDIRKSGLYDKKRHRR